MSFTTSLDGTPVLVTGATGFIGTHLTRALVEEGAEVSLVVRRGSDLSPLSDVLGRIRVFECELTDWRRLEEVFREAKPRKLFHMAAYTHAGREFSHSEEAIRTNLIGTVSLLRAAGHTDLDALLISGTCEEYGDGDPPFDEESSLQPVSPYSVSKAAASLWSQMAHKTEGLPVILVRPFLCYGPEQDPCRLVPQAIVAALEGRDFPMSHGEQTRDFTHVFDVVKGYLAACAIPETIGELINLSYGQEYRTRDIVDLIFRLARAEGRPLPGSLPYRKAEVWRSFARIEKADRLLGWKPEIALETGLAQTIEWYRHNWPLARDSATRTTTSDSPNSNRVVDSFPPVNALAIHELEVSERKLDRLTDQRGSLLKLLMREHLDLQPQFGEIYITTAHPGQVKGNHYHRYATEWFAVVQGCGRLVTKNMKTDEIREFRMSADEPSMIKIPPHFAHAVQNTAEHSEMILLAYADQPYDADDPDEVPYDIINSPVETEVS